jgi:hypothetical protein
MLKRILPRNVWCRQTNLESREMDEWRREQVSEEKRTKRTSL